MANLTRPGGTGSIAGWDSISTDQSGTTESIEPSGFSRGLDLQALLALRANLDPTQLTQLVAQIQAHLSNEQNPHKDTAANIGVDVFAALYNYWLSLGNTGTQSDFAAILFQNISIATSQDIINNIGNALVSVTGANDLIAFHNTDTNAHPELLALYFPGVPPPPPIYAIMAAVGTPIVGLAAENTTPTTYIDASGTLQTAPGQTMVIDYLTGKPLFSLWASRTNLIPQSDPNANVSATLVGLTVNTTDQTTINPDATDTIYVLQETIDNETRSYTLSVPVINGIEYVSSFFIYPKQATGFLILSIAGEGVSITIPIALATGMAVPSNPTGFLAYCYPLSNGWYRVGIQYTPTATGTVVLSIGYSLTNSMVSYEGSGNLLFALYGLMHTAGIGLSPYIKTTGTPVASDDTRLDLMPNIVNLNPINGMLLIRYMQNQSLTAATNRSLVQTADTKLQITLVSDETVQTVIEDTGGSVYSTLSPPVTLYDGIDDTSVAISWSPDGLIQLVSGQLRVTDSANAAPINSPLATFFIGPIDGYLASLVFYQTADAGDNLEFLVT